MATIRDTDLLYVQRGETPHNWTGLELKSLVSAAAKDGKLTIGQYLTPNGQTYDGSSNLTINVDGTSAATANKVVVRDSNGDFAGNVITAASFIGDGQNLTNTGASLSAATGAQRLVVTGLTSGTMTSAATDSDLYFDASTNTLHSVNFSGDGSGLSNTGAALSAAADTQRLVLTSLTTGTMISAATDGDLTFNASTNTLACPNFNGNASSSTKLATARSINGTNFDGTSNITTETWGTSRTVNGQAVNGSTNYTLEPYVERDDGSNSSRNLTFVDSNTAGFKRLNMDTNLTYNPSTNTLTASVFSGSVSGNASSASKLATARSINGTNFDGTANITTSKWGTARNLNGVSVDGSANKTLEPYVERDDSSNANRYITFADNNTAGYKRLNMDTNLSYNPSTNVLATSISGVSTNANNIKVNHDSGNSWHSFIMVDSAGTSGDYRLLKVDSSQSVAINPSSHQIRATTFVGDLDGNASTASSATNTTNFNVAADNGTNSNHYVIFTGGATGNQRPNSDTALYYNPSSNTLNAGNFNSTSDISLKGNIRIVEDPLTILKDIEGVRFDWKETGRPTLGVVAQNVETVLPELVDENEGLKSVNYNGLISVLIEAVKEQQKQIDELKSIISSK